MPAKKYDNLFAKHSSGKFMCHTVCTNVHVDAHVYSVSDYPCSNTCTYPVHMDNTIFLLASITYHRYMHAHTYIRTLFIATINGNFILYRML